ncbi:MAG TPA: 4-hydroxy-tetrahydrodipicolinate synthase [Actinobacteria bacterium]|nr:4-hydroxy-tetrahydrodipicolinate synthase [Actinomycetota bacterium]
MDFGEVLTAMVTPFNPDLSVNYGRAQELAVHLIENGSDGVVVSGTTGESPTLTPDEKIELFKFVKEAVGSKGKVIAGTGYNCTSESIELTHRAEKVGVDGCMLVGPYYNKPPQEGLYRHFKMIAESTLLPVIVYNVPSRTACNIEAETVVKLSAVKNIVAVKEASGNLDQVSKISAGTPNDFRIYSGDDSLTLPILAIGGDGVISVASHVAGKEIKEMVRSYKNGDVEKAREIHLILSPLFKALFMTTNPIMVKSAVKLKGIDVGSLRPPLVGATREQIEKLEKVMKDAGIL